MGHDTAPGAAHDPVTGPGPRPGSAWAEELASMRARLRGALTLPYDDGRDAARGGWQLLAEQRPDPAERPHGEAAGRLRRSGIRRESSARGIRCRGR